MDSGGDAPSGRGDTTSAHDACEASGSRSVDIVPVLSTTPAAVSLKVSARARLALEASPYSERQVRRRESRARAKTHALTQPRGVGLGAHPSTSKAPVVGPDDYDCRARDTEKRVAAATRREPRASAPATSTPKPSARVVRQSPEAHARRLRRRRMSSCARLCLESRETRVPSAGSSSEATRPTSRRRRRGVGFGDPTPASTPAGAPRRRWSAAARARRGRRRGRTGRPRRDGETRDPVFGTGTPSRAAAARGPARGRGPWRGASPPQNARTARRLSVFVRLGRKARRARTDERRDADAADADVGTPRGAPAAPRRRRRRRRGPPLQRGPRLGEARGSTGRDDPHREPRELRSSASSARRTRGRGRPDPPRRFPRRGGGCLGRRRRTTRRRRLAFPGNRLRPRRTRFSRRFARPWPGASASEGRVAGRRRRARATRGGSDGVGDVAANAGSRRLSDGRSARARDGTDPTPRLAPVPATAPRSSR